MGFESFRVELRPALADHREVIAALEQVPHIRPDPHSLSMRGSSYYLVDDGEHCIELELVDSPLRLSCRFTLSHPASVDSAFLGLVQELMMELNAAVTIRDHVLPEDARPFSAREFPEFAAITSRAIAARRAEWVAAFGDEPLAATTSEVHQRIILPRCR